MMRIQREINGRPRPLPVAATGPFKDRLIHAKVNLVTAVLSGQSCYVQGEDAPLRYRLLTDAALRLAELNQFAAYFDLSDLAYQYDLTSWIQNSIRLLAIQLNLPLPTANWWAMQAEFDPVDIFIHFLGEAVLPQIDQPVMLSFDEADRLIQAPLASDFWRLLNQIRLTRHHQPNFQKLTVLLWGKSTWQTLANNKHSTNNDFRQIIL